MKVLVTGGAGFIGSHIVERLIAEGHQVAVVDDFSTGKRQNLGSVNGGGALSVDEVDIRSKSLKRIFTRERPEVVIHLAAQVDVRRSVSDPVHDAEVNIIGTLNVLERSVEVGARRFVVASSGGCVYGEAKRFPIKESARGTPDSPYGISKRVVHDYLEFYRTVHGLESAILAMSNVCGPRQDPWGEAGVVAMFLGAMLHAKPTTIYGDGAQTRDFVAVSDVADAYVRALSRGAGVINIGTSKETSVLELWRACARVTGYKLKPTFAAPRPGELQRNVLDIGRAAKELGWKPRVSLRRALQDTASFLQD